jgi:alpha-N-arabinofuranosidase
LKGKRMRKKIVLLSVMIPALLVLATGSGADSEAVAVKILDRPLHGGLITPLLYGNFVELLDDVVPGMWAEMLGDRGFDGIAPTIKQVYHQGALNLCDRDWDKNPTWAYDADKPWNGKQSARIDSSKAKPGSLTQSALAVKKGMTYIFSGYFRADAGAVGLTLEIKALCPDGTWMTLGRAGLRRPGKDWGKLACRIVSSGTTDRAVIKIRTTGEGRVWADKLSLMPADNIDGWRRDVVEAVREMRPPVLRWGGSTVDPGGYRWLDGIGDRDRRTPFLNMNWGRIDSNDVGIEEFIGFCRAVGADPLVCVSFADGPESAGRMVEYLNGAPGSEGGKLRAANGHRDPYGVKYWQIGNEVGDIDTAKRCREFCLAIRKADPGAVLFTSFPSELLIANVGDLVSYFCPHYYTPDLAYVEKDIRSLRETLRTRLEGRDVGLAVTEWNIDAGSWGLGRGRLGSLGCALFEARFLNVLRRNSDIMKAACRSNLANSFCGGTIQTNASGLYKIPAFYVMKLYRDHSKDVPLKILQESVDGLDLSACRSLDGKSCCLFLVNSRKEPVIVDLDASMLGPGVAAREGETVCDTQDRFQPDVTNFWDRPNRIRTVPAKIDGGKVLLPALSVTAVECR